MRVDLRLDKRAAQLLAAGRAAEARYQAGPEPTLPSTLGDGRSYAEPSEERCPTLEELDSQQPMAWTWRPRRRRY